VLSQAQSARDALQRDQPLFTAKAFSHPSNTGDPMPQITLTQEQLDEKLAQARREAEEAATHKFSAQGQELAELRATRQAERVSGLINGWKAQGLIVPADEVGMREFMGVLDDSATFEFSAPGNAAPSSKSPLDWFAQFMAARKPVVQLGKLGKVDDAAGGVDINDPTALTGAANEFMASEKAAGRTVSFEFAVQHVASQPQA